MSLILSFISFISSTHMFSSVHLLFIVLLNLSIIILNSFDLTCVPALSWLCCSQCKRWHLSQKISLRCRRFVAALCDRHCMCICFCLPASPTTASNRLAHTANIVSGHSGDSVSMSLAAERRSSLQAALDDMLCTHTLYIFLHMLRATSLYSSCTRAIRLGP